MPADTLSPRRKKNAPFDLPPELQGDFDSAAEQLGLTKKQLLSMALAKGLPIVRKFLRNDPPEATAALGVSK